MKRNFCSRFAAYAVLAIVAGWSAGGRAQSAASHVAGSAFDGRSTAITHSQSPLANEKNDAGPAPVELALNRMLLLLEPSSEQASDLEVYLRELQDLDSPNYHRWLTPQQFGERFGASSSDIQAITSWLQSQGFTVGEVAKGRQWIEFSGTAGQVEGAFHAPVHQYVTKQGVFFANAAPIEIPSAVAPVVVGLVSLNGPEARSAHTPPLPGDEAANGVASSRAVAVSSQKRPLTPQDFASIYNLKPLYAAGFDGTGETIAVVTRSSLRISDVVSFREVFGLPENAPQLVLNGDDPGLNTDEAEAVLDASWTGAVAPGAAVQVVASKSTSATDGVDLSIAYAVDHATAQVISTSYVACEAQLTGAHERFYEAAWRQAAVEGITVAVAAGDSGAAACEMPESETPVSSGLSVNGIASTRYNTAVGGTAFGPRTSQPESIAKLAQSAYIAEQAWSEGGNGFHAGGGGFSNLYVSPEWQGGVHAPGKQSLRSLPDLSLAAAAQDGSFVGYSVFYQNAGSRSGLVHFAGTSASTAAFAGMMAIVNQYNHSAQGNANPHLYGLAKMGGVFHDVSQGTQQLPCEPGSPSCIGSESGWIGYVSGDGYDLATGLGSVDANAMVTHWAAVPNVGSNPVTLTVTPSSATPTYGSPFTATATLAYTGATAPTGTVTFTFDGVSQGTAPVSTTAGTATATLAVPTPAVGSHNLAASYGGDANFAAATTQSVSVVVSKGTSVLAITAVPAILTAGTPETFTAVLSSGTTAQNATFTGNIQFFDGTTPLGTPVAVTMNQAVSPAFTLDATVPHAITAVYYGDGNWGGSTSPQLTLKATSVSAVVSLQVSSPVVLAGSIVTFTATIGGNSASPGVLPTGTVIFYDGGNPIGQSNVVSNLGVATATLFTSILSAGVHNVTAAYQGDSNFKAATSSAVSVAIENYSITPNVTTLTLSRGQSAGVIYTLASGGGLNATIQFSCAPPPGTQMTCAFNPSTLTGAGQTVLTVTTTAGPSGMLDPRWFAGTGSALACVALLASPFGLRGRRSLVDRGKRLAMVALLAGCAGSLLGCGNSISANPNNPSPSIGTPLGVQTLTITTATTVNGLTTTQRSYLSVDVQ